MSLVLKDRVRETTTTTGTGSVTLDGAVTGFQAFSVIGSGNSCYYCIADKSGANWEVGIGTYNSAGNTFVRNTVLSSSNSGALVSFGAGTKDVFVTQPSEKAVYLDTNNFVGIGTATPNYPLEVRTASDTYGIAHSDGTHILSTYVGASGVSIGAETNDPLILKTYDTEQMRIDTAGNVGIGTNSPTVKLDVAGGITGTTVTANTIINLPAVTNIGTTVGKLEMVDGGDGYDYLNIWTDESGTQYPVTFPAGLNSPSLTAPVLTASGDGTNSGEVRIYDPANSLSVTVTVPTTLSSVYTLQLPTTAGSANQVLKTDGTGVTSWVTQGVQGTAPVTVTTATYTVAATNQWIIGNRAGTITLTLPTASSSTGRSLNIKTIQAQTVVSASSNVVPLNGGAAGTAILAATIGKYATLVSDGTNWIIMGAN
jgi:hypothetical protein